MRFQVTNEELAAGAGHVEPGTYSARIDKVNDKAAKSGNPMMIIGWTITGTEPPAGTKVSEMVTMIPEAYWRVAEIFEATGFKSPDGTGFESQDLLGLECKIVLADDTYEGRTRSKVQKHLPLA